jgi:hypothetical protein
MSEYDQLPTCRPSHSHTERYAPHTNTPTQTKTCMVKQKHKQTQTRRDTNRHPCTRKKKTHTQHNTTKHTYSFQLSDKPNRRIGVKPLEQKLHVVRDPVDDAAVVHLVNLIRDQLADSTIRSPVVLLHVFPLLAVHVHRPQVVDKVVTPTAGHRFEKFLPEVALGQVVGHLLLLFGQLELCGPEIGPGSCLCHEQASIRQSDH